MKKVLEFAHQLLADVLTKDDLCIDMTVGNGNDTIFLAKIVKHVYGFDIQKEAIMQTKQRLKDEKLNNVTLYLDNHAHLSSYGFCAIKGIIFNLGYLPHGDKKITTQPDTTILALQQALSCLKKDGVCVCVIYPGHNMGFQESKEIEQFVQQLDQKQYEVLKYAFINQMNQPPYLIAIQKLKEETL